MANMQFTLNDKNKRFLNGGRKAKEVLISIEQEVQTSVGDFDLEGVVERLEYLYGLTDMERKGALGALADFIGSAIEGAAPDLNTWNPHERVEAVF